jgi:hypothetical protein
MLQEKLSALSTMCNKSDKLCRLPFEAINDPALEK